jgi:uncharacterized protein (TIGR02118 family)
LLKVISLLKRLDGMSREEFYNWAKNEHPKLGLQNPTLRHYRMNVARLDEPEGAFDAVSEMWFDDAAAFDAGFATEAGKAARADAMSHCSQRVHVRVEEEILK